MWTEEKANAWIAEKSAAGEVPRIGRIYDALHSISSRDKIWLVEVAMKASVELSLVRDYAQALRAFIRIHYSSHHVPLLAPHLQQATAVRLANRVVSSAHIECSAAVLQ